MSTIRRFMFVGAGVSCAVWLLWLLLGGIFSAASSIVPHAWVIVLVAMIVGIVAWVLRYPATTINTLGDNKLVWGLFQTVLVVAFVVLFIQAVLWMNNGKFLLWIGIDTSPRVRAFMSVVVVALCLFPLPPLINWVVPTSGIFAAAVWRILFATLFLLLVASLFLPKTLFDPANGAPLAMVDEDGNIFYNLAKKHSPATGEKLEPITPEQAKKIKPWWERWWATVEKWNEGLRITTKSESADGTTRTAAPKIAPIIIANTNDVYAITKALAAGHKKVILTFRPDGSGLVKTPWLELGSGCGDKRFYYDLSPREGKVWYNGSSPNGESVGFNLPFTSSLRWEYLSHRSEKPTARFTGWCE